MAGRPTQTCGFIICNAGDLAESELDLKRQRLEGPILHKGDPVNFSILFQLLVNGLVFGSLLVLVALGLALIFGVMRIVNFAHGIFVTLGAYTTYLVVVQLKLSPLIGIPISGLLGAAVGLVLQETVIRRLAGRPDLDTLMTTYALAIIGLGLFSLGFGGDFRSYSEGPHGSFSLFGAVAGWRSLTVLIACIVIGTGTTVLVGGSRVGLALRALAQNRDAAATCGVNIVRLERFAFGLAVALAAMAGSLISLIGTTTPEIGQQWLLSSFVVVVLGGMGSIAGAICSGLLLGLVQSYASYFFDDSWAHILTLALLFFVLLVKPRGLLGRGTPI
jgi:branched-chain amino acid transport system permease protein